MEASFVGKREYGGKGRWVKYWAHLGCWISPCYGPFSLGGRFETYEPFIYLIFNFFSGRGKPRITLSVGTGAHLYVVTVASSRTVFISLYVKIGQMLPDLDRKWANTQDIR
jgi:hypothetical protein